ncbi:DUF2735 domain-containing protein [Mesorhizobium sp.]|uniref:DUF2735 domain-containing protein n=1 Tax=Mesorhizobium sp. TaxID=1871066 RepID=UPI0011F93A35|nr:DUF2735 domain-containing protein [Mesorhizobium sp.]TIO05333.1 MAG: DUF2735 domain-containing protein [Mesorhizobium sp.]TIO36902.1 MAG: DUF2735 domain-containing protein [Mesorhizobium sp.]TIP11461.1 MAG: DUF2735 domain-containing protein [Mesorhizobium sp.]
MEIPSTRQSAKILMFPVAARASASNLSGKAKFAAELASLRSNRTDFGSGWYHEAAIEEAKQDRES